MVTNTPHLTGLHMPDLGRAATVVVSPDQTPITPNAQPRMRGPTVQVGCQPHSFVAGDRAGLNARMSRHEKRPGCPTACCGEEWPVVSLQCREAALLSTVARRSLRNGAGAKPRSLLRGSLLFSFKWHLSFESLTAALLSSIIVHVIH